MTVDISKLYDSCVFRSAVRVDSHTQLQKILGNDHQVRWSSGTVDSALFCVETPRLKLMLLRYGPEVEVQPRPFMGFTLIQMPLRGSMQINTDSQTLHVGTDQAVVVSPNGTSRLQWSEDCEQIMLRVPHQFLREMARHPGLQGDAALARAQAMTRPLCSAETSHWRMLLEMLIDMALPRRDGDSHALRNPIWLDQMERNLALFTLLQTLHNRQPAESPAANGKQPVPSVSDTARQRLEAVERYAVGRLHAPISLEDLARAAGVRPRTLHVDCMRQHGVGPMVWLRSLRLEAARRELASQPHRSVTDVAIECGFGHLGRFAAYYRERFGELPSKTA